MERQSTTHSPRVDDEMKSETRATTSGNPTEARAEESRMMEPPAEGEPFPDARLSDADASRVDDILLGRDEVEARSELASYLRPSALPAARNQLLAVANEEHAPEWVLDLLATLPPRKQFHTVQEIWTELGGHREERVHVEVPEPETEPEPASDSLVARVAYIGVGLTMKMLAVPVRVGIAAVDRIGRLVTRR